MSIKKKALSQKYSNFLLYTVLSCKDQAFKPYSFKFQYFTQAFTAALSHYLQYLNSPSAASFLETCQTELANKNSYTASICERRLKLGKL